MSKLTRRALLALVAMSMLATLLVTPPAAMAENNGVGRTPLMGWSSWSFLRHDPTAANVEAQGSAMVSSGLASAGYQYVNLDDFWYQCPGSQGPNVDGYGRWVIDPTHFPSQGSMNGIEAVADYVHHLGLKFGIYVTPGISQQAVAENTAIEGTPYHAADIATTTPENNYNCGGMVGIDYSKPGAQAFIASWADEFASWGVDYVKLDGVGSFDIPDVKAWSDALRQTGRPIHLELSNSLNIADAPTWARYSNGWRTGGDIECYCSATSYPLTDWTNVAGRFDQVAAWAPYGQPGAFNDYDSIEVGNGANDGLTYDERKTQMSLWALASSPFILGTDLTHLTAADLALLRNRSVLAVDQDGIDASRISDTPTAQVFAKHEPGQGDSIVGMFNLGGFREQVSSSAAAIGLPDSRAYELVNLWTHERTETAGDINASVPSHGVELYRVIPISALGGLPPATALGLDGPQAAVGGQPTTVTVSFTDDGVMPVGQASLRLSAPPGWAVTPSSATTFSAVSGGQRVTASFSVTPPVATQPLASAQLTAHARYVAQQRWRTRTADQQVLISHPVSPPYQTFSSATDAAAAFGQVGQRFAISGAGADLFSGADAYSAIYLPGAVTTSSTIATEVTSQQALSGYGKAGIIVRNSMTGSGTTPEGVILFESPSGGIQLEWNDNGGTDIDNVTPPNGTTPASAPVYLELQHSSSTTYTGYYSTDPADGWHLVGTASVPAQASTQDAGLFVTSHTVGSPARVTFRRLTVTAGATPPTTG